jgi:hypothetical protein
MTIRVTLISAPIRSFDSRHSQLKEIWMWFRNRCIYLLVKLRTIIISITAVLKVKSSRHLSSNVSKLYKTSSGYPVHWCELVYIESTFETGLLVAAGPVAKRHNFSDVTNKKNLTESIKISA